MRETALLALGQIVRSAGQNIWDAHIGCAILAGALLIEERLISQGSNSHVAKLLTKHCSSIESMPRDGTLAMDTFSRKLLSELAADAEEPKEIGHDVIYSAYVLKALTRFEIAPSRQLLVALTTLIRKIKASGPGWITINGKNESRNLSGTEVEPISNYWETFARFDRPAPMEIGDMQLGHLLTHGHAISLLATHASPELLRQLKIAYHKRLRGLQSANDEQTDRAPLLRRAIDPQAQTYWRLIQVHGDMHGHVFKYAYSFLDLRRDRTLTAAELETFGRIVWPNLSISCPPDLS